MASFQVGDEVYIKGVIGEIIKEGTNYPVRVSTYEGWGVDSFTLDGRFREADKAPSLFRASEIQSKREYKIGQKLNGLAEVMQALIDGEFIHVAGSIYKLDEFNILYLNGTIWDKTSRSIDAFTSGTIAEDPTPKKMVAYKNSLGGYCISEKDSFNTKFERITKQELAAILERVE